MKGNTLSHKKKKMCFQAPGIRPQGASPQEETWMDGTQYRFQPPWCLQGHHLTWFRFCVFNTSSVFILINVISCEFPFHFFFFFSLRFSFRHCISCSIWIPPQALTIFVLNSDKFFFSPQFCKLRFCPFLWLHHLFTELLCLCFVIVIATFEIIF